MKKPDSKPHKESPEEELKRLRKENKSLIKKNKSLRSSKEAAKTKADEMRKELKKKDVPIVRVTEEQKKLLSILFPDIDTLL